MTSLHSLLTTSQLHGCYVRVVQSHTLVARWGQETSWYCLFQEGCHHLEYSPLPLEMEISMGPCLERTAVPYGSPGIQVQVRLDRVRNVGRQGCYNFQTTTQPKQ